ncbi:unnamed protein product [Rotaria sordida]|uniref:Uncharacterized protein n=1 Tax=Rotaria sordida TaxID=392033 RepID=A0A815E153_9BILA|nr:unnamed protein product [Rotaria sordida]
MNKVTSVGKHNVARIEHVTRLNVIKTKVRPSDNNEQYHTTTNTNTTVPDSLRSISPECISIQQLPLRNSGYITDKLKSDKLSSLDIAIIPPIYVFVIRRTHSESSSTNTTVSSCSSSTCIGQETSYRSSIVTALYPFDGNTNDQSGYYTGTAFGTSAPSYTVGAYISQTIALNPNLQQYVLIPNINLSKQSFTLQAWLRQISINASTDFGIFSQCDSNSICMSLNLRNARFVLSFDSMNSNNITLTGSTLVSSNEWVHVTVVYDATLFQQQIYVDGQIDALSNGIVNSYQGVSLSSTIIGRSSSLAYGTGYFQW